MDRTPRGGETGTGVVSRRIRSGHASLFALHPSTCRRERERESYLRALAHHDRAPARVYARTHARRNVLAHKSNFCISVVDITDPCPVHLPFTPRLPPRRRLYPPVIGGCWRVACCETGNIWWPSMVVRFPFFPVFPLFLFYFFPFYF